MHARVFVIAVTQSHIGVVRRVTIAVLVDKAVDIKPRAVIVHGGIAARRHTLRDVFAQRVVGRAALNAVALAAVARPHVAMKAFGVRVIAVSALGVAVTVGILTSLRHPRAAYVKGCKLWRHRILRLPGRSHAHIALRQRKGMDVKAARAQRI